MHFSGLRVCESCGAAYTANLPRLCPTCSVRDELSAMTPGDRAILLGFEKAIHDACEKLDDPVVRVGGMRASVGGFLKGKPRTVEHRCLVLISRLEMECERTS